MVRKLDPFLLEWMDSKKDSSRLSVIVEAAVPPVKIGVVRHRYNSPLLFRNEVSSVRNVSSKPTIAKLNKLKKLAMNVGNNVVPLGAAKALAMDVDKQGLDKLIHSDLVRSVRPNTKAKLAKGN